MIRVGRTWRGNVTEDLRPASMRPGQCSGEGDAGAGDLRTGLVRIFERSGDGDCGGASKGGGGHNCRFRVRATVDGDVLASAEAYRAADRDDGSAHLDGGSRHGGACRANRRDDGSLDVRACIDHNSLAGFKACHIGNFDVARTHGRRSRQGGSGLQQEIGAVAVGIDAIRKAARAPIDRGR